MSQEMDFKVHLATDQTLLGMKEATERWLTEVAQHLGLWKSIEINGKSNEMKQNQAK